MAIKDFDTSENKAPWDKAAEEGESHHIATHVNLKTTKDVAEADVKNAHSTGDGSFGRSDESLPEEEEKDTKSDNNY